MPSSIAVALNYFGPLLLAGSLATITSTDDVWRITSFLFLGSVLGVIWCCWSKAAKEENRITRARVLSGIVSGVGLPRLIGLLPWKLNLDSFDPVLIGLCGFFFGVFGFYIMHAFLRKVEARQNPIGGMLMKTLEKSMSAQTGVKIEEEKNGNERQSDDASKASDS